MDLSQYVNQLREDLASAAAAGDEQTRRTAALLGAAIEPAARLAVMNALSDLAAEVTAALPDHVVEVRLDGRDVRVSVSGQPGADEPEEQEEPAQQYGVRRVRRRRRRRHLPHHAAAGGADQGPGRAGRLPQGMSLNSWLAQTVQGALSGHGRKPGKPAKPFNPAKQDSKRIRGWVQG